MKPKPIEKLIFGLLLLIVGIAICGLSVWCAEIAVERGLSPQMGGKWAYAGTTGEGDIFVLLSLFIFFIGAFPLAYSLCALVSFLADDFPKIISKRNQITK